MTNVQFYDKVHDKCNFKTKKGCSTNKLNYNNTKQHANEFKLYNK